VSSHTTQLAVLVVGTAFILGMFTVKVDARPSGLVKLLAETSTTRSQAILTTRVYLRDDPEYRRELRALRAELAEAEVDLQEAYESVAPAGKPTAEQRREIERYLAPFRRDVQEAKDGLARLAGDYLRPFRSYGFRVRTTTSGRVSLDWQLRCRRGQIERQTEGSLTRGTPYELRHPPTMARAHSCYLFAEITRSQGGRVTLRLLGIR
jgi:hypothetical protein